jgi:hypothetical protein
LGGTELRRFQEFDKFCPPGLGSQIHHGEGDGEVKSPGASAPRVQVEDALAFGLLRLVGVATDNEIEFCGVRAQIQLAEIMQNIETGPIRFYHRCEGKLLCPRAGVHIAADGEDRGDEFQLGEDFRNADITGVDDQIDTVKGALHLWTQESMSIGDDAYSH